MNYEVLDELFEKIQNVTGLKDVAYHRIKDGRLNPVHKTSTDVLGVQKWKDGHAQNPVYINDTLVLQQIIKSKGPVDIFNTKQDSRSSEAFFFFGVDSILIVPVINNEDIEGIICIVSIGELHNFSKEEINKCLDLVRSYTAKIIG